MSDTRHNNETNKTTPESVVWMDAYEAEGEWYGTDYVAERRLMTTVGYVIAEVSDYISVASTYDPELEQYACVINIPHGMIITRTPILEVYSMDSVVSVDTQIRHQHSQHQQPQSD